MLENLQAKLQTLCSMYEQQKSRADQLQLRVDELTEKLQQKNLKIEQLTKQSDTAAIARALVEDNSNVALSKEKISKLIRLVDKCIEMLEQ